MDYYSKDAMILFPYKSKEDLDVLSLSLARISKFEIDRVDKIDEPFHDSPLRWVSLVRRLLVAELFCWSCSLEPLTT
jgi:hypothetical protein